MSIAFIALEVEMIFVVSFLPAKLAKKILQILFSLLHKPYVLTNIAVRYNLWLQQSYRTLNIIT